MRVRLVGKGCTSERPDAHLHGPPLSQRLLGPTGSEQCFLKSTPPFRSTVPCPPTSPALGPLISVPRGAAAAALAVNCMSAMTATVLMQTRPALGCTPAGRDPLSSELAAQILYLASRLLASQLPSTETPLCARRWADAGVGSWLSPEAGLQWQETDREGRAVGGAPERGAGRG